MNELTQKDKILLDAVSDINYARGLITQIMYEHGLLPDTVSYTLGQIVLRFNAWSSTWGSTTLEKGVNFSNKER